MAEKLSVYRTSRMKGALHYHLIRLGKLALGLLALLLLSDVIGLLVGLTGFSSCEGTGISTNWALTLFLMLVLSCMLAKSGSTFLCRFGTSRFTVWLSQLVSLILCMIGFLLGTLIPGETLTVPQFSVISAMGLYNNIWGVILPVVTTTTGLFMYRQHYMSLPLSLVEAARIDGASEWKIFSNIMLPLGSNVTITLTIFSFMLRWNDYILPLLVLSDQKKYTIQIAIKNFIGNTGVDWSSILAASVLSILPIVILFMILQKYIVGGVSAGGVKG